METGHWKDEDSEATLKPGETGAVTATRHGPSLGEKAEK